ncbi:MAG: Sir2 family NAD-dependent protein deacetylase [Chloroflexota bacterium]|nr:Sir2 family NAD-dependent protein deacetylase [Chloroflexota bacterium]
MENSMESLISRAANDLLNSSYAIALTGAGVSTESGIPDFRGPSGVWTKNPEAERKAYRSYESFCQNPKAWWEERLTSSVNLLGDLESRNPNPSHHALAALEKMGILKWVITQNIDGLHSKAGTANLLEYHGCGLKLRCMSCGDRFARDDFDLDKLLAEGQLPPVCPKCRGVVKTDTVAFGEPIPSDVARRSMEEAWRCDLMLICGTSAVVYPFASLPRVARQRKVEREDATDSGLTAVRKGQAVTIIEVNADPTPLTHEGVSDYLIQGMTGEVLPRLVESVKQARGA